MIIPKETEVVVLNIITFCQKMLNNCLLVPLVVFNKLTHTHTRSYSFCSSDKLRFPFTLLLRGTRLLFNSSNRFKCRLHNLCSNPSFSSNSSNNRIMHQVSSEREKITSSYCSGYKHIIEYFAFN